MTFSSAIFLPSKVANPFSSFHWCLKLPGLFSFLARKGHGHAIFFATPLTIHAVGPGEHRPHSLVVCQDSNTLPRCLPSHLLPSFTFYSSAAQRKVERQRDEALNGQSIIKLASFTGGHAIFNPELECFPSFPHAIAISPCISMVKT